MPPRTGLICAFALAYAAVAMVSMASGTGMTVCTPLTAASSPTSVYVSNDKEGVKWEHVSTLPGTAVKIAYSKASGMAFVPTFDPNPTMFASADDGKTWKPVSLPGGGCSPLYAMEFSPSGKSGVAFCDSGDFSVYNTTDGGLTWGVVEIATQYLAGAQWLGEDTVALMPSLGFEIAITRDLFESFAVVSTPVPVGYDSSASGWYSNGTNIVINMLIYVSGTTNNWNVFFDPVSVTTWDAPANMGTMGCTGKLCVGNGISAAYLSTDGGVSWDWEVAVSFGLQVNSIAFVPETTSTVAFSSLAGVYSSKVNYTSTPYSSSSAYETADADFTLVLNTTQANGTMIACNDITWV